MLIVFGTFIEIIVYNKTLKQKPFPLLIKLFLEQKKSRERERGEDYLANIKSTFWLSVCLCCCVRLRINLSRCTLKDHWWEVMVVAVIP